ncbi:hypothetical protein [uncultured Modestobacter sp.]|uniref:hypothetical protein n=1 Tax=uncultured Modestobacter sp. TaxID=380048 RepID=UPI00263403FA|nr:hypothetical protein [uncultured Modestobacter sp.]
MKKSIITSAMALALVASGGSVAMAGEQGVQGLCEGGYVNVASNTGVGFQQATGLNSSITGNRGVTLAISTSTTFTVTGTVSANTDISVGAALAAVKVNTGVSVAASKAGTTSASGAWVVPDTMNVGRLQIGAMKYRGSVTRYRESASCARTKVGTSVSYNVPKNEWHFMTSKVS